ncbi:death-inducer obliterator 1 [Uranotaenia lowii]|uniref:death-inducer obliterator 1 n=1 Tax=Uranotaenia lowii TaxID=190385 RepID=UPI00247AA701|nr:death-inducer obliterator 1 [Uranotaenia lowii]
MSSSVFKIYPTSSASTGADDLSNFIEKERSSVAEPSGSGETLNDSITGETEGIPAGPEPDHLKVDSNLVIVVGKDGSVHVDQKTLHSLLANETTDTSVSVVRITSPTPSIEEEIEEERKQIQEQKLQAELEAAGAASNENSNDAPESASTGSSQVVPSTSTKGDSLAASSSAALNTGGMSTRRNKQTAKKEDVMLDDGETPHVSLMVEGFYPPAEAKKFAEEVLTLAGLRKPLAVNTEVDYEFWRYVVANDHCYTPLTSPSQKLPPRSYFEEQDSSNETPSGDSSSAVQQTEEGASGTSRKRTASKIFSPAVTSTSKVRQKKSKEGTTDAEDLQSILEDSDSEYSEEESSYSDGNDNDSDLDFSIGGKSKKRKSSSSNRSRSKSTSKRDSISQDLKDSRKVIKSPKKVEPKQISPVSNLTKSVVPKTYGSKKEVSRSQVIRPTVLANPVVVTQVAPTPVVMQAQPSAVQAIKKDKKPAKPAAHVEALFTDMTSLFSTPDIIKKVGSNRPGQQINVVPASTSTIPAAMPTPSVRGFVQLVPVSAKSSQKLPGHISVATHTSASEEQNKRLELIDALVQHELPPQQSSSQSNMAEDIVKMLENNLPTGNDSELPITDNNLLAALGSNDDGLPEDLLQHVAELAENKELQEILDKQVLGVIGSDNTLSTSGPVPMATSSIMNPINPVPTPTVIQPVASNTLTPMKTDPEGLPTMTVKEQLMPRKEAIQIRRSDGRVITLPPIEAPATRSAKRRAQAGSTPMASPVTPASNTPKVAPSPNVGPASTQSAHQTPLSSKQHVKQSTKMTVGITSYDDGSGSLLIDESRGKAAAGGSRSSSRRTSVSSTASGAGRGKRQSIQSAAAVVAAVAEDDAAESDESWNSEDDPDRLWCICKQPHNNRFMICCDACEDWFHGKCVNITKAMGQQMEEDGIEWTCPNCLKKKQEKQQPKVTQYLLPTSISNTSTTSVSEVAERSVVGARLNSPVVATSSGCVVCGKTARSSSVYCSDDCIRKHAGISKPSGVAVTPKLVKDQPIDTGKAIQPVVIKSPAKSGPIIVMERKTGRCLTGKNAPTAANLKVWLLSHPTFEVVPPGSPQAAIILAKQAEVRRLQMAKEAQKKSAVVPAQSPTTGKVQTLFKVNEQKKITLTTSTSQPKQQTTKPSVKLPSKSPSTPVLSKSIPTTSTSSQLSKSAISTPKTTTTTIAPKQQKKSSPEPKPVPVKVSTVPAGENIRVTVKKTLKEQLILRTIEQTNDKDSVGGPKLTESEVEKYVGEIENEMFALFNKDTGSRYRAKYRSLLFNIKDRKNLSLFQKISEKRLAAKELVRMTAEELASQELAQWRENENKHQLEMIKKSELDLLACAKNYVLKTHKGEEVIEGKINERVQLDPTTAVEDVVAVLNNSAVSSTSEVDSNLSPSKDSYGRSSSKDFSYGKYSTGIYGSGSIGNSLTAGSIATTTSTVTTTSSTSTSSSSTKKKESRRSRSRSRSRERRRDSSRSRSKHKRRRSRSRSRHGSRDRERDKERHREHKKHDSKDSKEKEFKTKEEASSSVALEKDKNEAIGKTIDAKKHPKPKLEHKPQSLENFNLVDQILGSVDGSGGKSTDRKDTSGSDKIVSADSKETSSPTSVEQDQEPTSTVTIPTPPHSTNFDNESPTTDFSSPSTSFDDREQKARFAHWTGNVHMIDVASVEMSIRAVSGDIEEIAKDFSEDLNICGTIKPEIVLDYIGQIKKSGSKDICLVRFHSNESAAYYTLYSHLYSRKRYSVIKSPTAAVKDFYIFPLPSDAKIPMILKPLTGIGIIEGDKKPDLLLGIIVKIKTKRSSTATDSSANLSKALRKQPSKSSGSSSTAVSPSFALMQQVITKYATINKNKPTGTVPESAVPSPPQAAHVASTDTPVTPDVDLSKETPRSSSGSPEQIDVDMNIIKGPIVAKAATTTIKETIPAVPISVVIDDDDEPYSPGGSSNDSDNFADVTAIVENKSDSGLDSEAERIRREMEEINRKIAEEKNEIVGLISKADLKEDEIKSTLPPSLITDISIPSNLSEILASIKGVPGPDSSKIASSGSKNIEAAEEDEYIPSGSSVFSSYKPSYSYGKSNSPTISKSESSEGTSKLAKLTEEELLSMVPDDSYLQPPSSSNTRSKPIEDSGPVAKKSRFDSSEPPPPGMEDEVN